MKFSTQCPHCSTSFLIQAEQIRVASGLVRCGVCASIFEADRHLFEVTETPDWSVAENPKIPAFEEAASASHTPSGVYSLSGSPGPEMEPPSFTRRGRRRSSRPMLSFSVFALLLALLMQLAWIYRNDGFALMPHWGARVEALCGCRLTWPRHLDWIVIEQSSFRVSAQSGHVMKIALKNKGPLTVTTPDLMLTLMDAKEKPIIQKHVTHEVLKMPKQLLAGQTYAIELPMRISPLWVNEVVGFDVQIFYP
jgi:predicted Zn finger-like uncharacterized protein